MGLWATFEGSFGGQKNLKFFLKNILAMTREMGDFFSNFCGLLKMSELSPKDFQAF